MLMLQRRGGSPFEGGIAKGELHMMSTNRWRKTRHPQEAGQVAVFMVLVFGLALLGAVAFSIDMGNLWFHRQAAQSAADAACTAGAMDLLVDNTNGITTQGRFTAKVNTSFDCNATTPNSTPGTAPSPCQYAALNQYTSNISASSTGIGNNVTVSFPAAVTGVSSTSSIFPPAALAPTPFMRVDVLDNVQTYFWGLLSGSAAQPVRAFAVCGTVLATSPIPIIVLNPTIDNAFHVQGNPTVGIIGGANRSIQVNSSSSSAVSIGGNGGVNLACGGSSFTGSGLGVFGGPSAQTASSGTCPGTPIPSTFPSSGGGFIPGATGAYQSPASPISDPFAQIPAPTCTTGCPPSIPSDLNATNSSGCTVTNMQKGDGSCTVHYTIHGCPDTNGCDFYTYGYYPGPGSSTAGAITVSGRTAIFDPGVYYLNGGMALQSNSLVRPGTGTGDGSGGTMFYFTGTAPKCSGQQGAVCVGSNSGTGGGTVTDFDTSTVKCPAGPAPDSRLGIPPTLSGNVLLAPCTGTYGDPTGQYRGMLFFQNRSSSNGGGWGGGGGFLLAGSMYFHQCNAAGTGTGCGATPTDYNSVFTLYGNAGSHSYVLGEIVTDQLYMQGDSTVLMALNPNATYSVLKATLLR
jgi:putative Flp pilus-assembly TadE/G-like protein